MNAVIERVLRGDCTVYNASTGGYCIKRADHVDNPEPAVARHDWGGAS